MTHLHCGLDTITYIITIRAAATKRSAISALRGALGESPETLLPGRHPCMGQGNSTMRNALDCRVPGHMRSRPSRCSGSRLRLRANRRQLHAAWFVRRLRLVCDVISSSERLSAWSISRRSLCDAVYPLALRPPIGGGLPSTSKNGCQNGCQRGYEAAEPKAGCPRSSSF